MIKNSRANYRSLSINQRHQEFLNNHNLIITPIATPAAILKCEYVQVLAIVGSSMNHSIEGHREDFVRMVKDQLGIIIDPNDIAIQIGWMCEPTPLVPTMQWKRRSERKDISQEEKTISLLKENLWDISWLEKAKQAKQAKFWSVVPNL